MSKHLEILENFNDLGREALVSLLGDVFTTAEDVAFAYDVTEEMSERLADVLDEYEVHYQIIDEGDL